MKHKLLALTMIALVVVTFACGPTPTPETPPTAQPPAQPTQPAAQPPAQPTQPAAQPQPTQPAAQPTQPSGGGGAATGGLDFTQEPNFGTVDLASGFMPDPLADIVVSGGTVDVFAQNIGNGCTGYATSAPDLRINWSGTTSNLRIFFVADNPSDDTTLIVNDPFGAWHCNDDFSGWNPLVDLPNLSDGQIDIWIGSYASGEFVAGTLYITELDYDPANLPGGGGNNNGGGGAAAGGLDFAQEPNFGTVDMASGFWPDPHTEALVSGGSVDVSAQNIGNGCNGYATSSPDLRVRWSGTTSNLRIFFVADDSNDDTTLIVNDPFGAWHCNDDFSGWNPLVDLPNLSDGQIDIWIGSYASGEFVGGTLYITELSYDPGNLPY